MASSPMLYCAAYAIVAMCTVILVLARNRHWDHELVFWAIGVGVTWPLSFAWDFYRFLRDRYGKGAV